MISIASLAVPAQAAASDSAQLRELVRQDCGACHGLRLGGGLGPGLRAGDLEGLAVDAIAAIVRNGVPDTAMPPWQALLSEQEIQWISRKLKSGSLLRGNDPR
ncbi:c-type cytochrome [Halomonadaceae bacterium KBTZ08]